MKEITVTELRDMQVRGDAFVLIDVREAHEHEAAQMGGTLIPMGEVGDHLSEIPTSGTVVVHCRSGARSAAVIKMLEDQHGYTNLYNLKGGIMAWSREIDPSISVS